MATHSRGTMREGAHGVVYVSGARTGGRVQPHEALQGRRIRGIFGGRGQFVAVVDAWELDWQLSRDRSQVLEQETVALGLKGDIKIQQVAFGERHRVAVTLDGHLYSWGTRDATFATGELGHVASEWHPITLTPRTAARRTTANATEAPPIKDPADHVVPEVEDDEADEFDDREDSNGLAAGAKICQPRRVHAPQQLFFTKVACGAQHSVALTDKGDLYAWGRNFEGQLGLGSSTLPVAVDRLQNGMCAWPKYVSALLGKPPVTDVACADCFTIALLADGTVWRWGERVAGITAHPQEKIDAKPQRLSVAALSSSRNEAAPFFTSVAAGTAHALGVTKNGELYAWGLNTYGQLGLGDDHKDSSDSPLLIPTLAPNDTVWTKVFAGSNYSAVIASDGQLFTWGNGHHGKLGHGSTQCEYAPRPVDALRSVCVTSAVCGQFHLYAFAPTVVTSIFPTAGEIAGGYEMRIGGSGFWDSEDLTVRFVPLTEGRLPRGALGRYDAKTQTIVCQVPTFSLPGEFAVEVATNGKHFTTDGHVFEAFKRPIVVSVSRWEARLEGGDEVEITLEGGIPNSCKEPLLGLIVEGHPSHRVQVAGSVVPSFSTAVSRQSDEGSTEKPSSGTTLLRFTMPALSDMSDIVACPLELSFNGGTQFAPVCLDTTEVVGTATAQCVLRFHAASVVCCRPNSFQARALPTSIELDVRHLLPYSMTGVEDWSQLSVELRVEPLNVSDPTTESRVDVTLPVVNTQRSSKSPTANSASITCTVPPITEWKLSKLDAKTGERVVIMTDWWKFVPRWGFEASIRVSMNGGLNLLPTEGGSVYGVFSIGKLLTASPLVSPHHGGTLVSIAADYFHFDTDDAVVLLKWRDQREIRVTARCSFMNTSNSSNTAFATQPLGRRLTFTTAALPFPMSPSPSGPTATEDDAVPGEDATPAPPAPNDTLEASEQVEVFVSLDGRTFPRESTMRIAYLRTPELMEIVPSEASPTTRMVLKIDKAPSTDYGLPAACVRLTTATLGLSTVVAVEINEAANAVEFVLPVLPATEEESVRVAFSLDGQQFYGDHGTSDSTSESTRMLSFKYRAPPPPSRCVDAIARAALEESTRDEPIDEATAAVLIERLELLPQSIGEYFVHCLQRHSLKYIKNTAEDGQPLTRIDSAGHALWQALIDHQWVSQLSVAALPSWLQTTPNVINWSSLQALKGLSLSRLHRSSTSDVAAFFLDSLNLSSLCSLNLSGLESVLTDERLLFLAGQCQQLTHVDVSYCLCITDVGLSALILANHGSLASLRLDGVRQVAGSEEFISALESCNRLHTLSLEDCIGLAQLPNLSISLTKITSLNFQGLTQFSDEKLRARLSECFVRLKQLKLGESEISCSSLLELVSRTKSSTALVVLDLSWCQNLTSEVIDTLVRCSPLLQSLTLRCTKIHDSVLEAISVTLACLRELDLERCDEVTSDGFRLLTLSGMTHLEKINLSWTSITSAAAIDLLSRCSKSVRKLRFQGCKCVESELPEAMALTSPVEWPRLEFVDFAWTNGVDDKQLQQLARKFTKVRWIGYYGGQVV